MTRDDWAASVQDLGGRATSWPFKDVNTGWPAAYFDAATYTSVYNAGLLPSTGTRAAGSNTGVYVLASAMVGNEDWATTPGTMTALQSAENTLFSAGDAAASAAGLPSLAGIEQTLKTAALAAGLALVGVYALGQFARGRGARR